MASKRHRGHRRHKALKNSSPLSGLGPGLGILGAGMLAQAVLSRFVPGLGVQLPTGLNPGMPPVFDGVPPESGLRGDPEVHDLRGDPWTPPWPSRET